MSRKRPSPLWEYLEQSGVLVNGSDEEIKAVKKAYRKQYLTNHKREQRTAKPEFTVRLSKENREYDRIIRAAKKHHLSIPSFLRSATLAYMERQYLVPNPLMIAHLEQLLSDCLNEIKKLINAKEKFFWERERKIEAVEKRITRLEQDITTLFRNPSLVSTHDNQDQILKEA